MSWRLVLRRLLSGAALAGFVTAGVALWQRWPFRAEIAFLASGLGVLSTTISARFNDKTAGAASRSGRDG